VIVNNAGMGYFYAFFCLKWLSLSRFYSCFLFADVNKQENSAVATVPSRRYSSAVCQNGSAADSAIVNVTVSWCRRESTPFRQFAT